MSKENLTSTPRERVSVGLSGIDTSTPDDIVQDGKCETLHNMRYEADAWRPVHPYSSKTASIENPFFKQSIVYHHPQAGDNKYIVLQKRVLNQMPEFAYLLYDNDTNSSVVIAIFSEEQTVSHFGNMLRFTANGKTAFYLLNNGTYKAYSTPSSPRISISNTDNKYASLPDWVRISERVLDTSYAGDGKYKSLYKADKWYPKDKLGDILLSISEWNDFAKRNSSNWSPISPDIYAMWLLSDADAQDSLIPLRPASYSDERIDGAWHGEIALFATYRTADGEDINPSALALCLSDNELPNVTIKQDAFFSQYSSDYTPYNDPSRRFIGCEVPLAYYDDISVADIREYCPYKYILPTISVDIDRGINTSIITSMAIYATRINPIFDASLNVSTGTEIPPKKLWAQNNLPEQPFYLVKEFNFEGEDVNEYIDHYSLELGSLILQQSLGNRIYTPAVTHTISGDTSFDYNNADHIGGVHTIFREDGILSDALYHADNGMPSTPYITIPIGDREYKVKGTTIDSTGPLNAPYNMILSYHDYRAKRFIVSTSPTQYEFTLRSAKANNIAYYVARSNDRYKYNPFTVSSGRLPEIHISLPSTSDTLYEPNRIQVSAANNCLSFPFDRSYSVGSSFNRIIAMQSAAIKIGDEKVGSLPLYVFTSEGIYALRAGESTLYAAVSPINYDKIINPNTLAINGAIVYITERGVHLLTNNGTQVISTPINDSNNTPPLDFLRSCALIYPKEHNEIILHNDALGYGKAYVYNIEAGYWSTRDLKGYKLNTDELVDGVEIYDLANEDESKSLNCEIVTRPLKLGDVEFKRLETIIPRMSLNEQTNAAITISGAVQRGGFYEMRYLEHTASSPYDEVVIRRTPFSARYFMMQLAFSHPLDSLSMSISHIDIEWYKKLRHRMMR